MIAQQDAPTSSPQDALFVFLDCTAPYCDFDHFRRDIVWVNWVRNREDADIHLLITAQRTGGGGWNYTLDFIGRGAYEEERSLEYVSDPDDTAAEIREGLTRTLALGLVPYVGATPVASLLSVVYRDPEVLTVQRDERDPWNLWTFRLGVNGSITGEAQESGYSISGSATADRVAEDFKINIRLSGRERRDEFEIDDTTKIVDKSEDYTANVLVVWSLDDHWSAGGKVNANRATFENRDLAVTVGPALEYNIFPYDESTRRQLTFQYAVEGAAFDYELETVEDKMSEFHPRHSLIASATVQQPWGSVSGSVEGIQYLHDLSTHRIDTFASIRYRLFRGLEFNAFGWVSRIKDQFFLPKEGLTEEEILLRRRQRETDFRYSVRLGFSYRFGSKFANVVNPRMGGGGFFIMH
jgi:hypothetical protein